MSESPQPKQAMEPWAKAYILAIVFTGVAVIADQVTDDDMWLSAGLVAAGVCVVLGTVWLISGALKKRRGN